MKNNKVLKTIIIIASILAVLGVLVVFIIIPQFNKYADEHNCATIIAEGVTYDGVMDAFGYTCDYFKGDHIYVDGAGIIIDDISRSGKVTIHVEWGELYDGDGNAVDTFVLQEEVPEYFKTENGYVQLEVTWICRKTIIE